MSRKSLPLLALAIAAALAGCNKEPAPAATAPETTAAATPRASTPGANEGQLDIIAWAGYIERGESDKNYDWVTGFEKDTGHRIGTRGKTRSRFRARAAGGQQVPPRRAQG